MRTGRKNTHIQKVNNK